MHLVFLLETQHLFFYCIYGDFFLIKIIFSSVYSFLFVKLQSTTTLVIIVLNNTNIELRIIHFTDMSIIVCVMIMLGIVSNLYATTLSSSDKVELLLCNWSIIIKYSEKLSVCVLGYNCCFKQIIQENKTI